MIAFAVAAGLLAIVVSASDEPHPSGTLPVTIGLVVVAVALAVAGWLRARSAGALTPFAAWSTSDPRVARLTSAEQRAVGRQAIGREPVTAESAELVRDLIGRKRRRSRAVLPSLATMFLIFGALTVSLGHPAWAVIGVVALVAFLLVVTRYEKRREDTALSNADAASARP